MRGESPVDAAGEADLPPAGRLISVLAVDDVPIYREGIAEVVRADPRMYLVGEAGDGREGFELTRLHEPDVVLLDVFMPHMAGDEFMRRLCADRRLRAKVKVILLTAGPNPELHDAIMLRPDAMLFKVDTPQERVCEEIVALVHGGHSAGRELFAAAYILARERIDLKAPEIEMLRRVAQGQRAQAIALEMGCTESTVNRRLRIAREKLGVTTTAGAIARAYEVGILSR
jgi:DNA-binding NarL/FixJ family response regulator